MGRSKDWRRPSRTDCERTLAAVARRRPVGDRPAGSRHLCRLSLNASSGGTGGYPPSAEQRFPALFPIRLDFAESGDLQPFELLRQGNKSQIQVEKRATRLYQIKNFLVD